MSTAKNTKSTSGSREETLAHKVNRVMAFVLIFSGIGFVLIAILALWDVFGENNGEVIWRALGSLGAIALGALIVSISSRLIDGKQK